MTEKEFFNLNLSTIPTHKLLDIIEEAYHKSYISFSRSAEILGLSIMDMRKINSWWVKNGKTYR